MEIQEKEVKLRKIIASKGKIIISKEVDSKNVPILISKEIYLGKNTNVDEFEEIDENDIKLYQSEDNTDRKD